MMSEKKAARRRVAVRLGGGGNEACCESRGSLLAPSGATGVQRDRSCLVSEPFSGSMAFAPVCFYLADPFSAPFAELHSEVDASVSQKKQNARNAAFYSVKFIFITEMFANR